MKNLPIGVKILLALALGAIVVVLIQQSRTSAAAAGWDALAAAARDGDAIPALRTAAEAAKDTPAEPWVALKLARKLYDEGGVANLDQARSIAQQTLDRFPGHPAADGLSRLVAAVNSLTTLAPS